MKEHDDGSVSGTDDPGQAGVSSQQNDRLPPEHLERNITRREKSVMDDEAAMLSREKWSLREKIRRIYVRVFRTGVKTLSWCAKA